MFLQKKIFSYPGGTLSYYEAGQGQPLLFLHGGMMQASTYTKTLEVLATKYHVFAPDLPGFGTSSGIKNAFSFSDFATIIIFFLDFLNRENVTVVGHSFGGGVATQVALKSPRVSHLVLADANGVPPSYSMRQFLYYFFILQGIHIVRSKNIMLITLIWRDFFKSLLRDIFRGRHALKSIQKASLASCPNLSEITIPTTILWSSHDEFFPVAMAHRFHKEIPKARLEIIEGYHDWCLFEPEKLLLAIE